MSFEDKYANLSAVEICERIGQPYKRLQKYCITACYNTGAHKHGDRKPSLTVYGGDDGYYCYACEESGTNSWLLKQFGVREENYMPTIINRVYQPEAPKNISTDEYCARLMAVYESLPPLPEAAKEHLAKKGFEPELFEEMPGMPEHSGWKWHTNQVRNWGEGIFIPYMFEGKMVTARLRWLNGEKRSMPGNTLWPYNLDAVMRNKRVFITEGETDCLTVNFVQQDVPAVGIPGATAGPAIARLIEQAACYDTRLIVLPDNDEPGRAFAKRVQKDVNEWYQQTSPEQLQAFFDRYAIKEPVRVTDRLAAVRDVFGNIEDVTNDPAYQDALTLFA